MKNYFSEIIMINSRKWDHKLKMEFFTEKRIHITSTFKDRLNYHCTDESILVSNSQPTLVSFDLYEPPGYTIFHEIETSDNKKKISSK